MKIRGNDGFIIERSLKMRYIVTFGMHNDTQQMIGEADGFQMAEAMAKAECMLLRNPWTSKVYEMRAHTTPRLLAEYENLRPPVQT